jgi:hypothetical protein
MEECFHSVSPAQRVGRFILCDSLLQSQHQQVRLGLSGDDVERILEETLTDSENRLFDPDDNLNVINDFSIHEAIEIEGSENQDKDSVQDSASALQGGPSVRHLHGRTWLIM